MKALVVADELAKQYGSTRAIDRVSFDIGPGEIVGLIGPNGAGKSTLLKALLGLIRYQGRLSILGQSPRQQRATLLASMSYIADVSSLPEWITVARLLDFMSGVHPEFKRERALAALERTRIRTSDRVKALSKGMKTQLHLALIMGVDSRLLVLDEPTLGLDIIFRSEFYETLVGEYFDPGRSILVTTHQVEEIEKYLTRVMFIHRGRILIDLPMSELADRYLQLSVDSDADAVAAQRLGPAYAWTSREQRIMIFDNQAPEALADLGQLATPSLADLFVAVVKADTHA